MHVQCRQTCARSARGLRSCCLAAAETHKHAKMVRYSRLPSWSFPSTLSRLPEHYYQHRMELNKPGLRVHDRPVPTDFYDFKYDEGVKRVKRVADYPIEVMYPKEADTGLWGGEGIVKGYIKPRKYFIAGWPRPRWFFPELKRAVFYSEILDKHFSIICTERTLSLVDKYKGFDNYILRSNVQDFKSQLALSLRGKMLLTLAKKEFKDEVHEKEMLDKYGDVMIPAEQAEWFGLPIPQALTKYKIENAKANPKIPRKYELSMDLLEQLKNGLLEEKSPSQGESTGWLNKVKNTLGLSKS